MKKNRMTKDTVPTDFTLNLAIVDAIPVLFFCASAVVIGILFQSALFVAGAALVFFAGAVKVLWKIIAALKQRNIWWMFVQMRVLMPLGMLMMAASLLLNRRCINGASLWRAVSAPPSSVCFLIGVLGMVLMTVFAFRLDSSDVKSNWIEQLTNGIAQAAIFLGVLLLLIL